MAETLSILLLGDIKGRHALLAEQLVLDSDLAIRSSEKPHHFERPLDAERIDFVIGFDGFSEDVAN